MDQKSIAIKMIAVAQLKSAHYNPRKISNRELDKLTSSIKTFGLVEPIVVNADMTVIGGHQRIAACTKLGHTHVPCIVVDLPPAHERLLNIALNKISGEWDTTLLAILLGDLKELPEVNMSLSGFDGEEMMKLLEPICIELKIDPLAPAPLGGGTKMMRCPRCGHEF
jgi:ParB-like chromosome segregation protein Spo0J